MATDLSLYGRVGRVSSTNPQTMTVKVTFPDKNDMISADLPVLNRGSKSVKDYWLPDVGEQVLCAFLGNGISQGFVIGSFFSKEDAPQVANQDIRRIDFGDGSFIEHNRASGDLNVTCTGNINLKGANINLN